MAGLFPRYTKPRWRCLGIKNHGLRTVTRNRGLRTKAWKPR